MNRQTKICEECGKISHVRNMVRFKGLHRCYYCYKKASCFAYIPALSQIRLTKKDLGEEPQKKVRAIPIPVQTEKPEKPFWVGLSRNEKEKLYSHYIQKGCSETEAVENINMLMKQIDEAHKKFSKEAKPTFKEMFEKLISIKEVAK